LKDRRAAANRSGQELERLTAALERLLAGSGASIEAPSRRLVDKDTGRRREHVILIVWDHGHHQIITAVECRDRSRPVGVPAVEAFADKCSRTGINSAVIVSSRGFTETARAKAKSRSITCMDLAEVGTFDWLGSEAVVRFERKFDHVDAQIMFNDNIPSELQIIRDVNGTEVSAESLMQTIVNSVPAAENPDDEIGKTFPVNMKMTTIGWTAEDTAGTIWPIDHILACTQFTTVRTSHPFRTHAYSGGGRRYEVVTADAQLGEHAGKFVFLKNDDDTVSVNWIPVSASKAPRLP